MFHDGTATRSCSPQVNAPTYDQSSYDAPTGEVHDLVDLVVGAHRYPAIVVDSRWDLVAANAAASLFLFGVAEHLILPTTNVIRLSLHDDGLRPRVMNFDEYAGHVLARFRRLAAHSPIPHSPVCPRSSETSM